MHLLDFQDLALAQLFVRAEGIILRLTTSPDKIAYH